MANPVTPINLTSSTKDDVKKLVTKLRTDTNMIKAIDFWTLFFWIKYTTLLSLERILIMGQLKSRDDK